MSKLFDGPYECSRQGMARTRLDCVARDVRHLSYGTLADPKARVRATTTIDRIRREDLPADLRTLYDELRAYLGVA